VSGTAPPIVAGSTIGAAFAEVVAAAAAATPAVIDADGPLTYGDLDTRSAAVAAAVREAPQSRVRRWSSPITARTRSSRCSGARGPVRRTSCSTSAHPRRCGGPS